jgi:hypothetical protein
MIRTHLIYIFIQLSFKFTIEFVRINVGLINLIVNLKIKCIENVFIYIIYQKVFLYIYTQ